MSSVCIIDTSVFLNLLNVPGRNQDKLSVAESFKEYVNLDMTFILPMATIIETGNHIAQNGDGGTRRKTAHRFCEEVKGAFSGEAPYQLSGFPSSSEILAWIDEFPEYAGKNRHQKKQKGMSFGDLSIIKEFEKYVKIFPTQEVFVWSLDEDLRHYHSKADASYKATSS